MGMLRHVLPESLCVQLFGDRRRYGRQAPDGDPDWQRWLQLFPEIYQASQRPGSLEARVNAQGYHVLAGHRVDGLAVAEIGPGGGYHLHGLQGSPACYTALDVTDEFYPRLERHFASGGGAFVGHVMGHYQASIPLETASQDLLLSFYSLEHLHPLSDWLAEMRRVLKPGGKLVGAIPAEGGVAWGLGRWLTSRRVFRDRYGLDLLKLICWSHPNMCDEILQELRLWGPCEESCWPLPWLSYDFNLVVRFSVLSRPRI